MSDVALGALGRPVTGERDDALVSRRPSTLPVPPSIFGSPHPWLRLSTAVKTFHRQSELRLSYRTARTVPSESLDNRARWLIASAYDATAIEVDQLLPPSLDQLARRDRLAPNSVRPCSPE